ncbi:hypothetical protein RJ640_020979 [Escallonia rubra]|uniref:Integrase catalytic domain-containing protein n=1 Tax=Escallonia rubra TaxID=112253 RepID=A0AA88RFR9_9ASTE|nr:hypothetical protein RJ640_020979 [Escallonia rubra]
MEHQFSCTDTPQQNGVVERKYRHHLEVARALRFQAHLPIQFWGACILTVVYLINRMPLSVLQNKTTYEVLVGKTPSYDHIRSFGCLCYGHVNRKPRDKFAARSKPGIFVGYPNGQKGYRIFDLEDKCIYISRDVTFYEEHFPFQASKPIQSLETDYLGNRKQGNSQVDSLGQSTIATNEPHIFSQPNEPVNSQVDALKSTSMDNNHNIHVDSETCDNDPSSNPSVLDQQAHNSFVVVLIYVDDIVVIGNDSIRIAALKQYLDTQFRIKDLGKLKYFLGLEGARSSTSIVLSQQKYVLDILAETGMLGSKPYPSPMEQQHKLSKDSGTLLTDPERYRRIVGRLLYLTITRPDICYVVHILSQFMHTPRQLHLDASFRVLHYLKNAPGQGIMFPSCNSLTLHGYCDVDWAGCPMICKSTTGYILFLGSSPISWRSKKQSVVSRSSAVAEYRAMTTTTGEIIWMVRLLQELHVPCSSLISLYCDSQAAIHIAVNPVFHERTKHIEIDCHFIRHHVQTRMLLPRAISTQHQLADIFTKALGRERFHDLLSKLGISNLHALT